MLAGAPPPHDPTAVFWAYIRVCFVVASVGSWLFEHSRLREFREQIAKLRSHADIRGMIHDVQWVGTNEGNTLVVMRASIVNESADVSPTIRSFCCELEMESVINSSISRGDDTDPIEMFHGRLLGLQAMLGLLSINTEKDGSSFHFSGR